jgi:NAD(P)-dependent dehydrogenase (short-subunit alcohol dehydrogenase family)
MDELPLMSERRVALVVDGATDIGRAASLELGRRGYRVVVCDPDRVRANETGQRIVDGGGLAFAATARTDSVEEMRQVVNAAAEQFGPVEILVHASPGGGHFPIWGEFRHLDIDEMRRCIDGMLAPVLIATRLTVGDMIDNRFGRIVFVSTVAAHLGARGGAPYAMAKSALDGLTRSLSKEIAAHGVTVNTVMVGGLGGFGRTQEREQQLREFSHLGRLGTLREAGSTIAFLCSDDASYITGAILVCDGGITSSALI